MVYMITLENIFVQAIKNGQKSIEVRTRIPNDLHAGDVLLIAQKASHGRVVLICGVLKILEMHPDELYTNYRQQIHCPLSYYKQYTHGRDKVFGLLLENILEYPNNINTQTFQLERAPQWFTRVSSDVYFKVLDESLKQIYYHGNN